MLTTLFPTLCPLIWLRQWSSKFQTLCKLEWMGCFASIGLPVARTLDALWVTTIKLIGSKENKSLSLPPQVYGPDDSWYVRFHFSVHVYSNNEQMTSERGKTKKYATRRRRVAWLMFLPPCDVVRVRTHWQIGLYTLFIDFRLTTSFAIIPNFSI